MEGAREGGVEKKKSCPVIFAPRSDEDAATVAAAGTVSLRDRGRRLNETGSTRPISGPGR